MKRYLFDLYLGVVLLMAALVAIVEIEAVIILACKVVVIPPIILGLLQIGAFAPLYMVNAYAIINISITVEMAFESLLNRKNN